MTTETIAPEAKSLVRWVPRVLWLITAIHLLFGLTADPVWLEIARDGVIGTGWPDDDLLAAERGYGLYFVVTGIALLGFTQLVQDRIRATGKLPAYVGGYLVLSGGLICLVQFPVTGAWSLVAAGVFALYVSLRDGPRSGAWS